MFPHQGAPVAVLEIGCGAYAPFARICTEEGADEAVCSILHKSKCPSSDDLS